MSTEKRITECTAKISAEKMTQVVAALRRAFIHAYSTPPYTHEMRPAQRWISVISDAQLETGRELSLLEQANIALGWLESSLLLVDESTFVTSNAPTGLWFSFTMDYEGMDEDAELEVLAWLAPYVESGGELKLVTEYGDHFGFRFVNGLVDAIAPALTWMATGRTGAAATVISPETAARELELTSGVVASDPHV